MSYNTLTLQGNFSQPATAANKIIKIRPDYDWIRVVNETIINAGAGGNAEYYHQRGMDDGRGIVYAQAGGVTQIAADSGFIRLDSSGSPLKAAVATTNISNVVRPIVTAVITGLAAGDVVRLTNQATDVQLNGYDFTIDTVGGGAFRIAGALANAGGAGGAQAGFYRKINFDPLYYPRHRYIANIVTGATTVITTTVVSGYKVGQKVKVIVPTTTQAGVSDYGMVEINGLIGTITAVDNTVGTQTVTLDIDTSSGFTAFTFPTAAKAALALSKAMLVPIGIDTATAITQSQNILSDATDNEGFIGVELVTGAASPGGAADQTLYWISGKSFSVDNE